MNDKPTQSAWAKDAACRLEAAAEAYERDEMIRRGIPPAVADAQRASFVRGARELRET